MGDPLISEDAQPLTKLVGNEYELGWRSVWIHTPQEAVRLLYKNSRLEITVVRKENDDGHNGNMEQSIELGSELPEEGEFRISELHKY